MEVCLIEELLRKRLLGGRLGRFPCRSTIHLPRTMLFPSWLSSITFFEGPSFLGLLTICISPIDQCALVL